MLWLSVNLLYKLTAYNHADLLNPEGVLAECDWGENDLFFSWLSLLHYHSLADTKNKEICKSVILEMWQEYTRQTPSGCLKNEYKYLN